MRNVKYCTDKIRIFYIKHYKYTQYTRKMRSKSMEMAGNTNGNGVSLMMMMMMMMIIIIRMIVISAGCAQ